MAYLNYLYFIIIVYLYFKYLFGQGKIVKSPLRDGVYLKMNGPETFWCLVFGTTVFAFYGALGLDLISIRMMLLEILCIAGIFISANRVKISIPIALYFVYLGWILIGCIYSTSFSFGIRTLLKYLYPILLCLFASTAVRDSNVFMKSSLLARKIAGITLIFVLPIGLYIISGVLAYSTARAINYWGMAIFSLALFFFTRKKWSNMLWAIAFIIPSVLWVFRSSLMGIAMALMIFSIFKYKIKAIPFIIGVIALFVISVFAIPAVKQKMFYNAEDVTFQDFKDGNLSKDNVDSNVRFALWDWSLEHYYEDNEITGSGSGALQNALYNNEQPYPVNVPHNDYVQILCDNGIIGIVLFGISYLGIIVHCFVVYNRKQHYPNSIRIAALTAGPSLGGMMLTMYTENVVNYSLATLAVPLGFYGMMLGMIAGYKQNPKSVAV